MYKKITNALLLAGLLWIVAARILVSGASIQPDSARYASAGLNVFDYGVLSSQTYKEEKVATPGLYQGGVFTAFEIALAAATSNDTYRDLICVAQVVVDENCGQGLWSLKIIYYLETVIFHLCVLYVGYLFFSRSLIGGWVSVLASLGFYDTFLYASSPLSEQGYLMISGLFTVAWTRGYLRPSDLLAWGISGALAGLVVMVKPSWLVLPIGLLCVLAVTLVLDRRNYSLAMRAAVAFVLGFCFVIAPMFLRNFVVLDVFALSDSSYLISNLCHRLAFNLMTWREWFMGWVYYLPVSPAKTWFGADSLAPLGWGNESYYQYGRDTLDHFVRKGRDTAEAKSYLLNTFVISMPLKFIAVTMLLMWRGIFVGHLVGLIAIPSVVGFLVGAKGVLLKRWLFILAPAFFMAGVHAAVSVSIYRYNIPLIIPYCLAMAWLGFAALKLVPILCGKRKFLSIAARILPSA